MSKIVVYSKPACVQCKATVRKLDSEGREYEYVDLMENPERIEEIKALGYLQAPVVVTDTGHWSGYRPDLIDEI